MPKVLSAIACSSRMACTRSLELAMAVSLALRNLSSSLYWSVARRRSRLLASSSILAMSLLKLSA